MTTVRHDDEFEWEAEKARTNQAKHGVSFEAAVLAFRDRSSVEWIDEREDYGEERSILVGLSGGALLAVTYTERNGRLRIISAHRAMKHEQDSYFRQNAP